MKKYKGIIVEQSLRDRGFLRNIEILSSEIYPNFGWKLIKVNIPKDKVIELSKNLNDKKWYAHFWSGKDVIAVFQNKIFEFNYDKKETWKEAVDYGLSLGIPLEQLDFPTE